MNSLTGKVVSHIDEKTAVVKVESFVIHPKYGKKIARSKKFIVHDEKGVKDGELVVFGQIKPMSKRKAWAISEKKEKSK
jgi:small subunit ribosomal protein S17